jgi:hypothetical protein
MPTLIALKGCCTVSRRTQLAARPNKRLKLAARVD